MRFVITFILVVFISLISYQNIRFYFEWREVRLSYKILEEKLQSVEEGNKKLAEDLNYFQNAANLEKEARAQLNYKRPGEKLIVVVPSE